jgi:transcriptional regulator with XRE-family HTH domain
MSRNQRLHDAIRQSGKRLDTIADEVGADPKTVSRWITTGRLPRPSIRQQLAQVLTVPEAVLWPDAPGVAYGTSELVGIYNTRRELPPATVRSLLDAATSKIDVLAYSALWLWDAVPEFAERVEIKIAQGATVRICLGDADSDAVLLRGREEGVDANIASRCRLAIAYTQGIRKHGPDTVRITGATLYASIFRFDNELLLNTHLWGNPAGDSPVLHLREHGAHGIAANAISSFERVWKTAQPLPAG